MDVAANIETDSSAQFTLVIDERNGDALPCAEGQI